MPEGTATAAHQIEGGNWNNDWWAFEHTDGSGTLEPSGDACDSWNRWADDADLVRDYGLDNYRFSIEWSRIEPEDGEEPRRRRLAQSSRDDDQRSTAVGDS